MSKVNGKIKAGMGLLVSAILLELVLQWFFQGWINDQDIRIKLLLAVCLTVCCISGAILMIKGANESMVTK